ncbi:2-hydroxychromene-2-carboxylate isomerase/DsbA-like thioredoxin domain protein [Labilithrix luteola]|uniref:2-hydroxychromene-2-carboxylate isomerase/DsbA-like thioredoxin domain protein n=1 Tax=Labilithrix luteola TaxID=1391654 RepID=A0A0K1PXY5_9BACT|nr:DsbA family oxidoreductase [Labilithrix luteola]AKU98372.1 2-hydroxychromene-2-carboxylate isomerase/DsbA-like thioredoxin domain protein [Labilithrix luteola]
MNNVPVEVTSDFICPWCYVAEHRLAEAAKQVAGTHEVSIKFLPFELNPTMRVEGMDRKAYRSGKFGSWERSLAMDAHLAEVGKAEGLAFNYDRVLVTPNTRRAHRLVGWAQERGDASRLVHQLFYAYFTEGRDIGSLAVLADVAADAGLPRREAETWLSSEGGVREVLELETKSLASGTHAVPRIRIGSFVAEGAVAVSRLVDAIKAVRSEDAPRATVGRGTGRQS